MKRMELRNRQAWQESASHLESGSIDEMRLPAEPVAPLGRRRPGAARRKTSEARAARQSQPVDAVVGPARPAPVREAEHLADDGLRGQAMIVPPALEERLRERQTELQERLARLEDEAQEFDEDSRPKYSNHPADEAVAFLDRAGRDAVARVLLEDMAQVERALERLAAGSYGLCDDCGQMIPPKRLEARPTATLCVSCQSKRELRANRGRVIAH